MVSGSVVVFMGGWNAEREVSLVSGAAVSAALETLGYDVRTVDLGRDMNTLLAALEPRPDVVFNALHGQFGEDGRVQGVLDILAIPYTHSGLLASALAMDKPVAKRLFADAGIRCPEGWIMARDTLLAGDPIERPYVVKPIGQGSSVGVRVVRNGDNESPFEAEEWRFGDEIMVERYVPGREVTVTVMGDRALAVTELRPHRGFYDYAAKYTEGRTDHLVPAPLPKPVYREAMDLAVRAHRTLGCRGVTRADLRYDDTEGEPGRFYLLEINTQPGMTPLSLVPEQAAHAGIPFPELVRWMVENAACDG